ncbi:MAG: M48 family metallopeptidase [Rhodocyclaceae bacterium]|jgi:predicted metal-dependent hydrolase|nr:M48 family metallopeptidase [Rhodocyclaceae bacterium]
MRWANFLLFGNAPRSEPPEEQARSIALSDRIVPYTIRRRPRRSLSLNIDHRGLRVLGPMRTTLREVETLIHTHEDWILKKLDEWRDVRLHRGWTIVAEEPLPYLGAPVPVMTRSHTLRKPRLELVDGQLLLSTHDPRDIAANHRALVLWLREQAMICFEKRVAHYAGQLGVAMPTLALTQAKTRWGSCNNRGHIRLNWRLIHLPLPMIDYVVAHELAHLKEMNHSPRFWAVVETMIPDWRQAKRSLRGHVATLPLIEV